MEHKEKLQRTFVREEAYIKLRKWIIEGTLAPGQKLRDKDLAEQLGVSRTPIREALLRLEDEGLVQTRPNSTTLVSPLDFHNALHLYSIVWTLEQLALKQSFEFIASKHLVLMSKANEKLLKALKAKDWLTAVEADNEFHSVYIQLSQNNELLRVLSVLKDKLTRMEIHYFEKAREVTLSYKEHQNIIKALRKKDLTAALKAIELNWNASFSRMQPG